MSIQAQRTADAIIFALVKAFNLLVRALTAAGSNPHADITSTMSGGYDYPTATALTVTAANASDLATGIVLAEACRSWMLTHLLDGPTLSNASGGAHKAQDTTNYALITYTASAQLTSSSSQSALNTLLNLLKVKADAHTSQSGVHFTADSTNTISASNATDLASSITLANAIKAWCNAHGAFATANVQTVSVIA